MLKFSRSKTEKSWVACVWSHCLAIWRKPFGCVKSRCKFMVSRHELAGIDSQRQRGKMRLVVVMVKCSLSQPELSTLQRGDRL